MQMRVLHLDFVHESDLGCCIVNSRSCIAQALCSVTHMDVIVLYASGLGTN